MKNAFCVLSPGKMANCEKIALSFTIHMESTHTSLPYPFCVPTGLMVYVSHYFFFHLLLTFNGVFFFSCFVFHTRDSKRAWIQTQSCLSFSRVFSFLVFPDNNISNYCFSRCYSEHLLYSCFAIVLILFFILIKMHSNLCCLVK